MEILTILFTVEYILYFKEKRDLGARGLSGCVEGRWGDCNHARKHPRLFFISKFILQSVAIRLAKLCVRLQWLGERHSVEPLRK
jgi:hypothetical protein